MGCQKTWFCDILFSQSFPRSITLQFLGISNWSFFLFTFAVLVQWSQTLFFILFRALDHDLRRTSCPIVVFHRARDNCCNKVRDWKTYKLMQNNNNLVCAITMSLIRSFGRTNSILFGILFVCLFLTTYNIKELHR